MDVSALELNQIEVLRRGFTLNIDHLHLDPQEILVVVGPSGSGKSTLLDTISGRISCHRGTIMIEGEEVQLLPPHMRPVHTCWQVGGETLFPHLNAIENVEFGLRVKGVAPPIRRRIAEQLLADLGLDGIGQRAIAHLSGGERQRVAIARTLALRAPVVLLDEVTTGLDPELRYDLRQRLVAISRRDGVAMLYVSHDLDEARELSRVMGGHILILRGGEVQQWARWDDIYQRPANAFTARYVGPVNLLAGQLGTGGGFEVQGLGILPLKDLSTLSAPRDAQLLYGIRPEAIKLTEATARDALITGEIEEIREDRGAVNLRLRCGEYHLVVRSWRDTTKVELGARVGLHWTFDRYFLVTSSP